MSLEYKILGQDTAPSVTLDKTFVMSRSISSEVIYSTDGLSWQTTYMPGGSVSWIVRHGNGVFVGVVNYPTTSLAAYSTDAITWTQTTMPSSGDRYSVAYGAGKFVTISYYTSQAAYSTDGITWSAATMPASSGWWGLAYGGDKFVALSDYPSTTAAYSTDGITWTQTTIQSSSGWYSVAYGQGKFVAVSRNTSAAYSTDGITWTASNLPSPPSNQDWVVAYGNDKFVALGQWPDSNFAAYSTDGITWTQTTLPVSAKFYQVVYGDGKFLAAPGNSSSSIYSTDGITWTVSTLPIASANSVAYGEKEVTGPANQYTVPSTKEAIISSIYIANNAASSQTYSVAVVPDGETLSSIHYIRKNVTIAANDFQTIDTKITLSAGDQIITEGSSTDVSINVFGVEK